VIGNGTRSGPAARSLSLAADMFTMDRAMVKSRGPRPGSPAENTIALAIPILNDAILQSIIGYLGREGGKDFESPLREAVRAASDFLKEQIVNGKFFLADSAMMLDLPITARCSH